MGERVGVRGCSVGVVFGRVVNRCCRDCSDLVLQEL
jgi:hypothetical protein